MASGDTTVTVTLEVKPRLSLFDAVKLRIAGGSSAEKFWIVLAEKIVEKFSVKEE